MLAKHRHKAHELFLEGPFDAYHVANEPFFANGPYQSVLLRFLLLLHHFALTSSSPLFTVNGPQVKTSFIYIDNIAAPVELGDQGLRIRESFFNNILIIGAGLHQGRLTIPPVEPLTQNVAKVRVFYKRPTTILALRGPDSNLEIYPYLRPHKATLKCPS